MAMVHAAVTAPPSHLPHAISNSDSFTHHRRLLLFLNSCTCMSQLKQLHAQTIRTTSSHHPNTFFLYSRILHFSSLHDLRYAFRVFHQIENPNSFMWNALIRACARSTDRKQHAIALYHRMLEQGSVMQDKHTFPFVLKACAYLFALSEGEQIHAQILKLGFDSDVYINNSLVHFYATCDRLDFAKGVFDRMSERSLVSWNVVIDAFVRFGEFDAALNLFGEMQKFFEPDGYTIQSIANACAELALQLFHRMPKRDVTSWNSMILGFSTMARWRPHWNILVAWAAGIFDVMVTEYKIKPELEHYGCLVDLLARAGLIDEALDVVSNMPMRPDLVIWRSLLDACCKQNAGVELSEEMASRVLEAEGVFVAVFMCCCPEYMPQLAGGTMLGWLGN
ncbi:Pentatricopeptide repeat-containing protein, chloroplastic/mitochondrial [Vitis vinifera]|uniref:Pentatricopeptide repeat-containing protein, chloroplastic/mitochondrial n=1 Tax=Vitis vinifera TaxID=29760 RepID=A0A438D770_VITVI|nr:Pentatricopeptide repeat-containing protein, chloroplastic/mitochondrial [Vitis vinifera]